MIKTLLGLSRRQKSGIFLLLDMALVPLAFWMASVLHAGLQAPLDGRSLAALASVTLLAGGLSAGLGLHRLRLKDYDGGASLRSGLLALGLSVLFVIVTLLSKAPLHPGVSISFALVYFVSSVLVRQILLLVVTQIYRRSRVVTRVAIYGAGQSGQQLASELGRLPDVVVSAFLDDNPALRGVELDGLPVCAGIHAARVAERFKIDRVILAMPSLDEGKQALIAHRLASFGLEVQRLPHLAPLLGGEDLTDKLMPGAGQPLIARDRLGSAMTAGLRAYAGASILISGAGGSIGRELCRQLLAYGPRKLVLFELSELALYTVQVEIGPLAGAAGIEIVPVLGSIGDPILVRQIFAAQDIEIVVHAAAYKHVPLVETNARVGIANNVLGTAVLARAARDAGVPRFVLVSSDKAVRPGNLMGASKRIAELIVQDLAERAPGTIFSIVRFGNVLGSSGSVVPLFQEQIARGGPVTLTDERVTRYFMTIQEAARLVLLAGSFAEGGEVFVLDMGQPIHIGALARRLIRAAGYTVRDATNPEGDIEIVTTGLRPGEKMHEQLSLRRGVQTTEHPKIIRLREDSLSEIEVAAGLRDLREAVEAGDTEAVIEVVARMARDYAPQNLPIDAPQVRIAHARSAVSGSAE